MQVSVIIPTHNEAQAIERVLAELPSDLTTEVIVVDSNSNDGTPEIAARMGARVVQEPRRGYGRACLTGLATANSPDVVAFLDGDYSDRPSELPILLAPIIEGRADITLGSRLQGRHSGALPWHQVFGNRLAATLIRLLYGLDISDLGPFRAGRANVLRALALEETTYGWAVEMILKGALAGLDVYKRQHRATAPTWRASAGRPRRPKPPDQFLPLPTPAASAVHLRRADPKPNWTT